MADSSARRPASRRSAPARSPRRSDDAAAPRPARGSGQRAAGRSGTGKSARTRSEAARAQADHDNAWRQWVSDSAVAAVDTALAHVHAVIEDQVGSYGAFPAFVITGGKDGEFALDSLDPSEVAELKPDEVLEELRATARSRSGDLLVAALAYPATLPDRSGATAVIVEVEHRERLSLEVVQQYSSVQAKGRTFVNFGDPHTDRAEPWLFGVRD